MDGKNFKDILASTDLIEHRKMEEKKNPDYNPKFNRYKKNPVRPKVEHKDENEKEKTIRDATSKFLNQKMDEATFKDVLREEGIDPNIEGINKHIRQKTSGGPVNYSKFVTSIARHQKDSIAKPHGFTHPKLQEDTGKVNEENLMVPENNNYDNRM